MANRAYFHGWPNGDPISSNILTEGRPTVSVGLYPAVDYASGREFDVRSDNPAVSLTRGGLANNSREWRAAGPNGARATISAVDSRGPLDSFVLHFRRAAAVSPHIAVSPLLNPVFGTYGFGMTGANHLAPVTVPGIWVPDATTFVAGDSSNAPRFKETADRQALIGAFAATKENEATHKTEERAAILLVPAGGATPDRVLIGITHGFDQQDEYYAAQGWSDPKSSQLLRDVARRFVVRRWGAQMLAAKKNMALLLPVRAQPQGRGELGPFGYDGDFLVQVVRSISVLTGAFTPGAVEFFTYSSGIGDLAGVIGAVKDKLTISAIYNLDPAGARAAPAPSGAVLKQFLSGSTGDGGPHGGFEFMPSPRWANDPERAGYNLPADAYRYLHNHTMPDYCLYLGIETS